MAQVVTHRPLTADVQVRAQVSPCRICGGQSDTETGFPLRSSFSSVDIIPLSSSTLIYRLGDEQ
jgi:hypothetical protein